jgi:hypothetical protein
MTLPFHGLWMSCALGAAVFAAAAVPSLATGLAALAAFAAAAWWAAASLPAPAVVGTFVAFCAGAHLLRPRWPLLPAVAAGTLAGLWSGLLAAQGLGVWLAVALAGGVTASVPILRFRNPAFASDQILDEALIMAAVLGAGVAVLPGIVDGWQAAGNLTAQAERTAQQALPVWTLVTGALSLVAGVAYGVWSRR